MMSEFEKPQKSDENQRCDPFPNQKKTAQFARPL